MSDPNYAPGTAAPLCPDREYDLPASPHTGRAAALRVPVSQASGEPTFDRTNVDENTLMESEPSLEPLRFMEAGFEWTRRTERRVHELDRPVHPSSD